MEEELDRKEPSPSRLLQLIDFWQRDNRTAGMLALYYMLAMTSFTVLKPARDALLFHNLGPDWYSVAVILTAIVTGFVVWAGGYVSGLASGRGPVFATTLLLLVSLLLFRQLFETLGNWIYLPFYVFVQLFSVVLLTQFRLLAGDQFTPREAKRFIGSIGAGGTAGGILGPTIAFRMLDRVGTENLLYVAAGAMVLLLPLIVRLERAGSRKATATPESVPDPSALKLLRDHRHIRLIGVIICASMVAQTILDFQFKSLANAVFAQANDKTAFFAKFFAAQNVLALAVQLAVTRFLLVRFGLGVSLLLLPLALSTGAVGVLITPTLLVAGTAKFAEGSLRYSLQEASTEILYLPLSSRVRSRVRPMIDMFGARLFDGLGGLLILFCTTVIQLPVRMLSVVSLAIIGGWFVAVFVVKREYLSTLRSIFAGISAESPDRAAEVLDAGTVDLVVAQLSRPDERQALNALALLDLMHDKSTVTPALGEVVRTHPSPAVRAEALNVLGQSLVGGYAREAEALLDSARGDVRLAAVRYLCRFGRPGVGQKLNARLEDEDPRVRIAAIGSLARERTARDGLIRPSLEPICSGDEPAGEEAAAEAALLLGTIDEPQYDDLLERLLKHPSPVVVRAAADGAAKTGRRVFVPLIVSHLAGDSTVLYAQRALRQYGDRIVHALRDYVDDRTEPEPVRRAIPACYAAIGTQKALNALLSMLEDHQADFGSEILEALGEIHARRRELAVDAERVEAALLRAVGYGTADRGEVRDRRLRVALGLLALIYPPEDVLRARAGLTSGQKDVISNAIELLDNLLRPEHKRVVMPFLEALVGRST